jgi:hypothetical protein
MVINCNRRQFLARVKSCMNDWIALLYTMHFHSCPKPFEGINHHINALADVSGVGRIDRDSWGLHIPAKQFFVFGSVVPGKRDQAIAAQFSWHSRILQSLWAKACGRAGHVNTRTASQSNWPQMDSNCADLKRSMREFQPIWVYRYASHKSIAADFYWSNF